MCCLQSLTTNSTTDWSQASSQQHALDAAEQGLPGPEALEQLRSMSLEQAVQFYNMQVLGDVLWMGCAVGRGAAVALPPRAADPACVGRGTAGGLHAWAGARRGIACVACLPAPCAADPTPPAFNHCSVVSQVRDLLHRIDQGPDSERAREQLEEMFSLEAEKGVSWLCCCLRRCSGWF